MTFQEIPEYPTEHLHKYSEVGDEIYISNAQGDVYLTNRLSDSYVFIAGGVGITPLYSMIQHINFAKPNTKITLIYSITTPEEYLFARELEIMKENNPELSVLVTVTRTSQHQERFSGRINAEMLQSLNLPSGSEYYLCGPPQMVDNTVAILESLKGELDIPDSKIHYDKWWA